MTLTNVIAALVIAGVLTGCDLNGDYTAEQKTEIAKKCNAAGKEAEIHSSWSVCRSPNQISDE